MKLDLSKLDEDSHHNDSDDPATGTSKLSFSSGITYTDSPKTLEQISLEAFQDKSNDNLKSLSDWTESI